MNYHIWTIGCQMNKAESNAISEYLESRGFRPTDVLSDANLVVINTCVVRQHAEDKIKSLLGYVNQIKSRQPDKQVVVTGCFVGNNKESLIKRYPFVNAFIPPGDLTSFKEWHELCGLQPSTFQLPKRSAKVSAYVPIMQGCDNFCSYCIVPYRRGREVSRPLDEIVNQVKDLVINGIKEVILLGQNVNSYGKNLCPSVDLASLIKLLDGIDGLSRVRFLTNHPRDMSSDLIDVMAASKKVCHHICLPLQSGDNLILSQMNRHYSYEQYCKLIMDMRTAMPDISFSTDIIVGFPGETSAQFDNTVKAITEIHFDAVHVASYSPRPETQAHRSFADDVPSEEKQARLHRIEQIQKSILQEINNGLVKSELEILVEGKKKSKCYGRTYHDKLVFIEPDDAREGSLVQVMIESATPWSLQGRVVPNPD
jgi:tRNA-2-methylthio-N6-dimethylallyladenosine synthase